MPATIVLTAYYGEMLLAAAALGSAGLAVASFAINMVASSIISKAFAPKIDNSSIDLSSLNPGNRQQLPPAGDNKLPVVYGASYVGGIITDLSITSDNQTMYFVVALCEVTGSENGGSGDTINFGDVYFGGKRCVFDATDATLVTGLVDESTGVTDYSVGGGKLRIYLYNNGSFGGANTSTSAINVMSDPALVYRWGGTKLMSNCVFAIIRMEYNADAGLVSLQQTRFEVINSRYRPGDCFYDYLTSSRYGAAIPVAGVNSSSFDELNAYCDGVFSYTTYSGAVANQTRFRFDGSLDTNQSIMNNMQLMANCCDCLLKYNEVTGLWGVITQSPAYTVAMGLDDSNIVSSIQVTPLDIASSYNIAEVKFPDGSAQDSFASATFNLAVINPSLLYPNEPVNKQTISLPLVNNDVRAQYLANRFLEGGREDLQIKVTVGYVGLQLEAGDVVTLTNANYGWNKKLFRIAQVVDNFGDDGTITASLTLMEFNPAVYDDVNITQFTPASNSGIGSPTTFGAVPAPVVTSIQPNANIPSFSVQVTASASGVVQYAEVYYSAFPNPSSSQLIFGGTTSVNPGGNPYTTGAVMGLVTLTDISQGDWYFFARMVNALGASQFSPASSLFQWRPTTFQFSQRYLVVAYADNINGGGISDNPRGRSYFGLRNVETGPAYSSDPTQYLWFLAQPTFGTNVYLAYSNRSSRRISVDTDFAANAAGTGAFVPTSSAQFDSTIWSALPDGTNVIDLDARTGQLISTGTTTIGNGEIAVSNSTDGRIVAQLATLLDFGSGVSQKTATVAQLTIDKYGRVLGFVSPDNFNYTLFEAVATAGQTAFTPTARSAAYIPGQCLVFRNGAMLDTTEYTDTAATVTLGSGAAAGDAISIISMSAVASGDTYVNTGLTVQSVGASSVVYSSTTLPTQLFNAGDKVTFANTGAPTQYTVSSVNYTTRTITFSGSISGVTAGAVVYVFRSTGSAYRPMSRWTTTMSNAATFAPTAFSIRSGYEKLFLNGMAVNEIDYDLSPALTFTQAVTGLVTIIQFAENILTTPAGGSQSVATNTVIGQQSYLYNLDQNAFELYLNGSLLDKGTDYTTSTSLYTLAYTPTTNASVLQQTTYQRTGAA